MQDVDSRVLNAVRLGPGLWRNADHDEHVTVRADAGVRSDGRRYVLIEESASEIPFDEIVYESPSVAESPDPLVQALIED